MPIIRWRHYADHCLAPIRRSSSGSITAITDNEGKPREDALRLLLPAEYSCTICGARVLIDIEAVIRENFFPYCACWDNCPVLLELFGTNGPEMMRKQLTRVGRRAIA